LVAEEIESLGQRAWGWGLGARRREDGEGRPKNGEGRLGEKRKFEDFSIWKWYYRKTNLLIWNINFNENDGLFIEKKNFRIQMVDYYCIDIQCNTNIWIIW
jgi:hypothetical protein